MSEEKQEEKSSGENAAVDIEQDESLKIPRSSELDTVNDKYRIHLNEPIERLSNEFCKYYYASSINDEEEYFAIVYDNAVLHPIDKISTLHEQAFDRINKILAYSITTISNLATEHLVVIVNSYEYENTLARYIEDKGVISVNQFEKLVDFAANILNDLESVGIFQCNINPKNIIMQNDEFLLLREFIHSPPNFYQPNQYIAPELVECHNAARASNSNKIEIYALSITLCEAFLGKHPWRDFKKESEYNQVRLENTSFKYLLARARVAEKFRAFFRSTMHDDAYVRWKPANLVDWLNGKLGNYNKHELIGDKNNQLSFEEQSLTNFKSIAYAFFNNWDEAMQFVKSDKLYKWAVRDQVNNDTLEEIKNLIDVKSNPNIISHSINSHAKMSKLLSIIDPMGSLRQMDFAISADSISEYMHYLMTKFKKNAYENLIKVIKDEVWGDYKIEGSIGYINQATGYKLKNDSIGVNLSNPVKGIERFVYSLNPNARCLSKMLEKYYVTNLQELLEALDKYAKLNPKKFVVDRHIVAYVAAKLDIRDKIKPIVLSSFPRLSEHPVMVTLSLINQVHQNCPDIEIPNICVAITNEIKELMMDNLHGVDFKKKILDNLDEASKTGDLTKIIAVLSDQQKFINDYNGYFEACNKLKKIESEIRSIKKSDKMFEASLLLGQKTTVLSSYILCLIVTVVVML